MEEKLIRITNYFEAKLQEHQHAMMVQEQTIEFLINAVAKLIPQSYETTQTTTSGVGYMSELPLSFQDGPQVESNQSSSKVYCCPDEAKKRGLEGEDPIIKTESSHGSKALSS